MTLVSGDRLIVGETYRHAQLSNGHEVHNGGVFKVVGYRSEDGTPLGVKSDWHPNHKGVPLVTSSKWERISESEANPKSDPVNHPPHYKLHPSGVECIEITRHMTFNIGNAMKYLWRADHKNATIEDLEKAGWYIQDEIQRLKNLTK